MPRLVRFSGPAVVLVVAVVSTAAALAFGGGAAAHLASDPGPIVRWGLPLARLVVNLGAAGTIGALVLSGFALSPREPEFNRANGVAAASAAVFTVAAAVTGLLSFVDVTGVPLGFDDRTSVAAAQFFGQIALGRAWLATTLIAAAVTVLCVAVRNRTGLLFVAVAAVGALVPLALQGHSSGSAGHDSAVTALALHLVFAAIWLGGLITVVALRTGLSPGRMRVVIARYSTLALVSFVVVAASGYVSAEVRIGGWDRLSTPYGILVLVKVSALIALGGFGVMQRRFLIRRMRRDAPSAGPGSAPGPGRWFWWLVLAELGFMGLASGVAVALAKTVTPAAQVLAGGVAATTPAQILIGRDLPPELTFARYFSEWNVDLGWLLFSAFGIFFYLAGVRRLRRRGDSWPLYRAVLWVMGMVLLFYVTSGGAAVYAPYLFSSHMLTHMALTMLVPVLLVPGAPISLAARAIRKRRDGSRGPREWILLAVHSRIAGVLANPLVAAALFAGSLWVFYYSPLFSWATTDPIGHDWMVVHFLVTGYLFVQSLIGIDPVPYRLPYAGRLLLLLGTMAFHAFFGVTMMTGTGLLLADWYGAMGRTWGQSAIADQQMGGGIAWSVGEIPTIALAIAVAIQWSHSDAKETRRADRNADRTGEAELDRYNAELSRLASRDRDA